MTKAASTAANPAHELKMAPMNLLPKDMQNAPTTVREAYQFAVVGIGYAVYTSVAKPPRAANAGVVGPRLEVDREQLDLGDRPLNVPIRALFNVKNAGDDTLNLVVPQVVVVPDVPTLIPASAASLRVE